MSLGFLSLQANHVAGRYGAKVAIPLCRRPGSTAAHRDYWKAEPHAEEWLLIEWPKVEAEPVKYWLSTLPVST